MQKVSNLVMGSVGDSTIHGVPLMLNARSWPVKLMCLNQYQTNSSLDIVNKYKRI